MKILLEYNPEKDEVVDKNGVKALMVNPKGFDLDEVGSNKNDVIIELINSGVTPKGLVRLKDAGVI